MLDFGIPSTDRRKFIFLIKSIPEGWMENFDDNFVGVHETVVHKLLNTKKVPKNAYNLILDSHIPEKRYAYWSHNVPVPLTINWEKVHNTNFVCTIDTKLRSFYFKIFHKAIAFNCFLFKIKRKESPNCSLCDKKEETMVHLFCECEKIAPVWQVLLTFISQNCDSIITVTNFEKHFGICSDKFVSYLFVLMKYHIYTCKFNIVFPGQFRKFVIPFDEGVIQIREINLDHEIRSSNLYFGHSNSHFGQEI